MTDSQAKALITWCATPDPEHAILRAIRRPVLVISGSRHDTVRQPRPNLPGFTAGGCMTSARHEMSYFKEDK